jgi:hypothetical protein
LLSGGAECGFIIPQNASDAAEHLGTNTYEVISTVLARVPRVK